MIKAFGADGPVSTMVYGSLKLVQVDSDGSVDIAVNVKGDSQEHVMMLIADKLCGIASCIENVYGMEVDIDQDIEADIGQD